MAMAFIEGTPIDWVVLQARGLAKPNKAFDVGKKLKSRISIVPHKMTI